jgi:hypothetical protein
MAVRGDPRHSTDVVDLAERDLDALGLPEAARRELAGIKAALDEQYRDRFLEMAEALNRQAAALERIQTTLSILVEHIAPNLSGTAPVAFRVSRDGEDSDLASTVVTADPIGAGFTLTQADIGRALGLSEADVSILLRALKLRDDERLAVEVRSGKRSLFNYHPRVVEALRQRVVDSDTVVPAKDQGCLQRARRVLA